ncbi:N-acylneuraminate-9-phosphatase [Aureococcus anophagefferens]|nr:N-acylneuraminate-9-phosphatase [Aureococcus anophagefferens]
MRLCFNAAAIRAVSFDVTGTLLFHKESIAKTYADAAVWARLDDPPTAEELKPAFKRAYKSACLERPCFGYDAGGEKVVGLRRAERARERGPDRRRRFAGVYQFYGSREGYEPCRTRGRHSTRSATGARARRDVEHARGRRTACCRCSGSDHFSFLASSSDLGVEAGIFEAALERARFWCGADLAPHEVLRRRLAESRLPGRGVGFRRSTWTGRATSSS